MSTPPPESRGAAHAKIMARGAVVNMLGTLGKVLFPLFFVLITRLYSAELVGLYYLASSALEIAVSLTVSGFSDGILMYSSRYVDDESKADRLYDVLANGFAISLGIALVMVVLAHVAGPTLLRSIYSQPGAARAIATISWSLPFVVFPTLVAASTKALMIMKWDALMIGFLRPLLLLCFSGVFWLAGAKLEGLLWAWTLAHVIVSAFAFWVFAKHFSVARLSASIVRFRPSKQLVIFALPQNLNLTFNTFITNMDVMMLAAFGYPAEVIGFFGVGSQIVRNIRQLKLAFSGSYTPVIARYHEKGDTEALSDSFVMVTRWITSLALPVALAVAVLREDILRIFHASFHGDSSFMLWLLAPPLLSCAFGLAGNVILATGHSGYNLLNSMLIAGANFILNWLLIPHFGVTGAAAATLVASVLFTLAQLLEAHVLVGLRLSLAKLYKPYLAIAAPVVLAVTAALFGFDTTLAFRTAIVVVGVVAYFATLLALGIDPHDRPVVVPFLPRRRPAPQA